ncbi:uncharacterized mitochondrial protein AtMg00860-like [Malus sylvestris]|uniref:uncharacterized mitochondrial protein AtMg00860-like n=1 Tax=Malus sylvestris TaxID=3752 RepID=UPI0010A99734|nr:uncharacterized protein LOC114820428 [Malus domestica]XP_050117662.1 uncharacterized mitochondrial protein AtMg00860-like [Malus sylvestris]
MGKSKASITVADVMEDEMDREFQQHPILTQLQEFQEAMSIMIVCNEDLQQAMADLSVHRLRQDQHQLHLKPSKCLFGQHSITYLGHIISAGGVTVDPSKIAAIAKWPTPFSVQALCGFLGLTGYYCKFVRHFGLIAKPLIDLLKKDNFSWSSTEHMTFTALKVALSSTPVLALPDFTKSFTLECDASNVGIGSVLS